MAMSLVLLSHTACPTTLLWCYFVFETLFYCIIESHPTRHNGRLSQDTRYIRHLYYSMTLVIIDSLSKTVGTPEVRRQHQKITIRIHTPSDPKPFVYIHGAFQGSTWNFFDSQLTRREGVRRA
ncbi:hypothetical protein C8Q69DRAFT_67264 [Paecilomyces variotii]|uniref:Uncharacterized protein n=1 Tax=Byssochlamys spectabilis TaxID=264951 RepID=A0A443HNF6_BYSSP|nr:hypothetical protein C8Q69DRAFT_67264 [Paecilomyces variotii]RWQ93324.1 hypothetical protein C8Q69DRAFT_67264 [Paecilomyces variotii]